MNIFIVNPWLPYFFIHACAGSQWSWVTNFISVSSFTLIQNPCGQWKLGQDSSCKGVSNTPLLIHMTSNFHTNVKHICTCVTKAIIWLLQLEIIVSSSDTVEYKRAPPQGRGPSEHIQMDKTGRANEILFKQCFASGLIVAHNSMLAWYWKHWSLHVTIFKHTAKLWSEKAGLKAKLSILCT